MPFVIVPLTKPFQAKGDDQVGPARPFIHIGGCFFAVERGHLQEGEDFLDFGYFNLCAFVLDGFCLGDQINDIFKVDFLNGEVGLEVPPEFLAHLDMPEYLLKASRGDSPLLVDLFSHLAVFLRPNQRVRLSRTCLSISKYADILAIDHVLNQL